MPSTWVFILIMVLMVIGILAILLVILACMVQNMDLIRKLVNTHGPLTTTTTTTTTDEANLVRLKIETHTQTDLFCDDVGAIITYNENDESQPNNTINSFYDDQQIEAWNANVRTKINQFQSLNMLNEKITAKLYGRNGLDCLRPIPSTIYKKSLVASDVFFKIHERTCDSNQAMSHISSCFDDDQSKQP
jgi:hypothetical protein